MSALKSEAGLSVGSPQPLIRRKRKPLLSLRSDPSTESCEFPGIGMPSTSINPIHLAALLVMYLSHTATVAGLSGSLAAWKT